LLRRLALAVAVLLTLVPAAHGANYLRLGFDDDRLKWMARPNADVAVQRELGAPFTRITIPWRRDDADPLSRAANWLAGSQLPHEPLSVVSCALRTAIREPADHEMERHVSVLFDRIEKTCPRLFRGQTAVTEPLGSGWSRNYPGLDARLEASAERVILHRYRAGIYLDLGRLGDWEREGAGAPAPCR